MINIKIDGLDKLEVDLKKIVPESRHRIVGGPLRTAAEGGGDGTRRVRLFGREVTARVYDRGALGPGQDLAGPAIINQMDTTTWIPEGWQAEVVASGALLLERAPHPVPLPASGERGRG